MCVNQREYEELLSALDRSLELFGERPPEPGFDLTVYEELRRVRETLIRARRDMKDPNVKQAPAPVELPKPIAKLPPKSAPKAKRDSKSPLGA